jgi:hypothetical protein
MKRLAFLAMIVAVAACAPDADVSDTTALESDSARMARMRADSIRADSLRRDSIAKGLIDTSATR